MSISPAGFPVEATRPPNPARVSNGTQFSWGRFSSRVSSMDTIFIWGGMNRRIAFSVVVFPEAVPPQMSIDCPFSIASHMYAIISGDIVLNRTRSSGVKGFSRNRRIVNEDPRSEEHRYELQSSGQLVWR